MHTFGGLVGPISLAIADYEQAAVVGKKKQHIERKGITIHAVGD
jgi:hypothetical protein